MDTVIPVSAVIAMIITGVLLIHLLNGQNDERIAALHHSDAMPGIGRRSRKGRQPAGSAGSPAVIPLHREHPNRGHR